MTSDTSHTRERLGELLIRRRLDLDPRFRNRQVFADERGVEYRIVSDIERGRRSNFHAVTIAALEHAYDLPSGAIGRYLDGGELEQPVMPPRPVRREIDFSGSDPEGLRPWRQQVLRETYAAIGLRFGPGDVPEPDAFPGIEETLAELPPSLQPFRAPKHETDVWDAEGMMLGERVTLIARIRRHWDQAAEEARQQTGLTGHHPASGAVPALVPVAGTAARVPH